MPENEHIEYDLAEEWANIHEEAERRYDEEMLRDEDTERIFIMDEVVDWDNNIQQAIDAIPEDGTHVVNATITLGNNAPTNRWTTYDENGNPDTTQEAPLRITITDDGPITWRTINGHIGLEVNPVFEDMYIGRPDVPDHRTRIIETGHRIIRERLRHDNFHIYFREDMNSIRIDVGDYHMEVDLHTFINNTESIESVWTRVAWELQYHTTQYMPEPQPLLASEKEELAEEVKVIADMSQSGCDVTELLYTLYNKLVGE